jgi:hypothetical protein
LTLIIKIKEALINILKGIVTVYFYIPSSHLAAGLYLVVAFFRMRFRFALI